MQEVHNVVKLGPTLPFMATCREIAENFGPARLTESARCNTV
jgi:hypothetical protein